MKRKFLLCLLGVLLSTTVFSEKLKLNSDANLRSQSSKDSNIITTITKETYVEGEISQENPNWYVITASFDSTLS
ncbi:SH3 domain-containing protein [uncultured Treponema sp.]|uniref:SH3 domain-containing protein n=1 Tax=uncultured Treponema sp. TaxID=162155 RepID=UPI0015BA1948|nr:SH3 domain-containing protein [uncultured Treponema sp.]